MYDRATGETGCAHPSRGGRRTAARLVRRPAYFSDYSDIRHALFARRRARVAVLDGSGRERTFPTHQPMVEVIPIVKTLPNLTCIFFTHVGHTGMSHRELERQARALGDRRFAVAYHGLQVRIRETGRVPII